MLRQTLITIVDGKIELEESRYLEETVHFDDNAVAFLKNRISQMEMKIEELEKRVNEIEGVSDENEPPESSFSTTVSVHSEDISDVKMNRF